MSDADEGFERARGLLAAGDVPGLMRYLRADGGTLPLGAMVALTADAARLSGCGDLERAAAAAMEGGAQDAQALYGFGYACLDQGLAFLAARPLERALELAPGTPAVLCELVDALEDRPAAHSLVVAHDLNSAGPDAVAALRGPPGQVLFERATCWTDPPRVAADVSGLLGEHVLAPWDGQWQRLDDGSVGRGPADDRPVEVIAAELADTEPEQEEGDGTAPADPEDGLRRFARAVADESARERDGGWLGGVREWIPNSGPVPSSRLV